MAFKFRLHSLLKYRQQKELMSKKEYADAIYQLVKEQNILEELHNKIRFEMESMNGVLARKNIVIQELVIIQNYIQFLKIKMLSQQETINKLRKLVEGKKKLLIKSSQDRSILEKLEEKKKNEFEIRQNKKQQELQNLLAMNKKMTITLARREQSERIGG